MDLKKEMLYEGKAKQIFATEKPDEVVVRFKDDATAFNAQKKGQVDKKGQMNNAITMDISAEVAAELDADED